ncbi:MAG: hypothetical protein WCC52_04455 [Nitrosotalea sp.]
MQVHSRKLEGTGNRWESRKVYRWIGIAMIMIAILVVIGIVSIHYAEGGSLVGQICYHKGAHFCFFPKVTMP